MQAASGVSTRRRREWADALEDAIRRMASRGNSAETIATALRLSLETIQRILRPAGSA